MEYPKDNTKYKIAIVVTKYNTSYISTTLHWPGKFNKTYILLDSNIQIYN